MSSKKMKKTAKRQSQRRSLWIFLLPLAGILLVALGILLATRPKTSANFFPEVTGAPALKVDKERVDLGDVRLGQWVQTSFVLTNVGDQTLRFLKDPFIEVKEGC